MPTINRYNGKAMLKGKIQKTGNPKMGRKNIKWHIFGTSVSPEPLLYFEVLFLYHPLLVGSCIHLCEDQSLFPYDLGVDRQHASVHLDVFSVHMSHGLHSNPFRLCEKK